MSRQFHNGTALLHTLWNDSSSLNWERREEAQKISVGSNYCLFLHSLQLRASPSFAILIHSTSLLDLCGQLYLRWLPVGNHLVGTDAPPVNSPNTSFWSLPWKLLHYFIILLFMIPTSFYHNSTIFIIPLSAFLFITRAPYTKFMHQ